MDQKRFKELEHQFMMEDLIKNNLLYYAKNKTKIEIIEKQNKLNERLAKRKNLYIYPAKVNV